MWLLELESFVFRHLIAPDDLSAEERRDEAQVFIQIYLVSIPLFVVFSLAYTIIGAFEIAISSWIACFIGVSAYFFYRGTGQLKWGIHIFSVAAYVIVAVGSFWAGGIHAPGVIWFMVCQLFAIFLFSVRLALFWISIFVVTAVALRFPKFFGLEVVNILSPEQFATMKLNGVVGASLMSMYLVSLYKRTVKRRVQERVEEKQYFEGLKEINSKLLRGLTHDINNSLQLAKGALSQMERNPANDQRNRERISSALTAIHEVTRSLREQQLKMAECRRLTLQPVDLKVCIEKIVDSFSEQLTEKAVTVRFDDRMTSCFVMAEADVLLNSVFGNILANAIRYSASGGVVEFRIEKSLEWVDVFVVDQGEGMEPETLEQIFVFQARAVGQENDLSDSLPTGLGMPLTKTYVESFGGRISVESQLKQGTSVRVKLRAA